MKSDTKGHKAVLGFHAEAQTQRHRKEEVIGKSTHAGQFDLLPLLPSSLCLCVSAPPRENLFARVPFRQSGPGSGYALTGRRGLAWRMNFFRPAEELKSTVALPPGPLPLRATIRPRPNSGCRPTCRAETRRATARPPAGRRWPGPPPSLTACHRRRRCRRRRRALRLEDRLLVDRV